MMFHVHMALSLELLALVAGMMLLSKACSAETCGTQGSVHEHPATGAAGRAPTSC